MDSSTSSEVKEDSIVNKENEVYNSEHNNVSEKELSMTSSVNLPPLKKCFIEDIKVDNKPIFHFHFNS